MIYQISSGQGPAECELGVAKFLAYLQKHYKISVLETSQGYYENITANVCIIPAIPPLKKLVLNSLKKGFNI